jgi:GNAT superfamily N-acetyltransferase
MAVWRIGDDGAGELEDLHVVPSAWGTGVARELLRATVSALDAAGADAPFLWVGEANGRARRFYEREGWTYDGTREPSPLGPMQLRYRLSVQQPPAST